MVTRVRPQEISRTMRKSSKAMWVKNGLPAQSPTAKTWRRGFEPLVDLNKAARGQRDTSLSRPMPSVFGVRPVAASKSAPVNWVGPPERSM